MCLCQWLRQLLIVSREKYAQIGFFMFISRFWLEPDDVGGDGDGGKIHLMLFVIRLDTSLNLLNLKHIYFAFIIWTKFWRQAERCF